MPEGAGRLFDGKAGDAVSYDAVQRINLTVDRERDDAGIAYHTARLLHFVQLRIAKVKTKTRCA